ncbi:hypothetical protein L6452_09158 [Arctium lappa]|uniref:Uncharacterized protein n=1 Tax=Arctium lappa TaxID=4217 RepID=A0ACB9DJA2_ARCLA|nr:hypothetical protein L6452_09158 [Arctium lappa]
MADPIDPVVDVALISPNSYLSLTPNNYNIDFLKFRCKHQIVFEILSRHLLCRALTATVEVPVIYLQQVWHTIKYISDKRNKIEKLEAFVDTIPLALTTNSLLLLLNLPDAIFYDRATFKPEIPYDQLLREVHALGYDGSLTKVTAFNRRHLLPIWFTFFIILNCCLSSNTKYIDQCSTTFLCIFHGVTYHRQNFIPYMRFLQLAIDQLMTSNSQIPRRRSHQVCTSHKMRLIVNEPKDNPNLHPIPIPNTLLAYARPTTPSVEFHRNIIDQQASVVRPAPAGPTHGAQPERR